MALHVLSPREAQVAGPGDHSDGGGLVLRVRQSVWIRSLECYVPHAIWHKRLASRGAASRQRSSDFQGERADRTGLR
jgi:hypothetical protein